jgi:large subunit ribosomal protein L5
MTAELPRLKKRYNEVLRNQLQATLEIKNVMQVPTFEKIVLNMGVGRAVSQPSALDAAVADMVTVSGQKPMITQATKSIAGFKLREGQSIGCKVTLRGDRMWEFFDRLVAVAIPRIRDFRGLSPYSWDGQGNYTFGISDQLIFPEIDYDKVDVSRGMDITIVTTARSDADGKALLEAYNFPFKKLADAGPPPKKSVKRRGAAYTKSAKSAGKAKK